MYGGRTLSRGHLLILPALLALIILGLTLGSGGRSAHAATPVAAKPHATHGPLPYSSRAQYRAVGCESSGNSAYLQGPSVKEVAFGFDDGPAPDTSSFLSMLERNNVRATFFMIGEQITSSYRADLLRELRDGDVLGDHTWTHPELTRLSSGAVRGELSQTISVIRRLSGYTPCVFRPPYGAYNGSVVGIARSLGLATVLWNVDPTDWALPGTAAIQQRVLAQVRPGSIIISHDGGGPRGETLAAYPGIIRSLRARGYRIVTIPELLGFTPIYQQCLRDCMGIGVPRSKLPADAILQTAAANAER